VSEVQPGCGPETRLARHNERGPVVARLDRAAAERIRLQLRQFDAEARGRRDRLRRTTRVQLIVCRPGVRHTNMDDGIAPLNAERIRRTPRVARDTEELHTEGSALDSRGLALRQWEALTERDVWSNRTRFVTRRHKQETEDQSAGDKKSRFHAHDSSPSNAHARCTANGGGAPRTAPAS